MAPTRSKTRSGSKVVTTKTAAEALAATASTTQKVTLSMESSNPPKPFVLPKDISKEARILSLPNPRTCSLNRYLYCPSKGFFEFTKVGAPKTTPRSILLSPTDQNASLSGSADVDPEITKGYITKSADLFVATPIDPMFLILPILAPLPTRTSSEPPKQHFLELDDHLDKFVAQAPHLRPLLEAHKSFRPLLESRMSAVCDSVDAGDEKMYRLSHTKLLAILLAKAQKMVNAGLPVSMEEKLIRKALEAPMLGIRRGDSSLSEVAGTEEGSQDTTWSAPLDSQSSLATEASEASTTATSIDDEPVSEPAAEPFDQEPTPVSTPEGVTQLLRLRTAYDFISSSYLRPHLVDALKPLLGSIVNATDFTPLDTHLAHLTTLRKQATALRETTSFNHKRGFEDEEQAEARAEKRRKKEEEDKKAKAGMSRGVRDLKKVNVTGMKKMSDFFKKKA